MKFLLATGRVVESGKLQGSNRGGTIREVLGKSDGCRTWRDQLERERAQSLPGECCGKEFRGRLLVERIGFR